jgi:hypothetical protein
VNCERDRGKPSANATANRRAPTIAVHRNERTGSTRSCLSDRTTLQLAPASRNPLLIRSMARFTPSGKPFNRIAAPLARILAGASRIP